jgi:hypothetical protein
VLDGGAIALMEALMESMEAKWPWFVESVEKEPVMTMTPAIATSAKYVVVGEGGDLEGAGGILGRGESSWSDTASLSLSYSAK